MTELSAQTSDYDLLFIDIDDLPEEIKLTPAEVSGLLPIFGQ
jgi:hypothetical protein